ncbi:MAG TPA: hypothetical protein VN317_00860, partial [Candidatus Methanoperedens sp.]|nr:hypothetical protein [Candidatus Methanoperedens sp.]
MLAPAIPGPGPAPPPAAGPQPATAAVRVAWRAFGWSALLEAFLFFRPTPYGAAYVENWWRYFFPALVYNLFAFALLAAPAFALLALGNERGPSPRRRALARALLLGLPALLLALDQVDNELMRFMGVHLSPTLLRTFVHPHDSLGLVAAALLADRGGPLLPFALLAAVPAGFLWHCRRRRRTDELPLRRWPASRPAAVALALLLLSALGWAYAGIGGTFGRLRVQPVLFTLWREWRLDLHLGEEPPGLGQLIASYQAERTRAPGARRFTRREFPLVQAPGDDATSPFERAEI